MSQAGTLLSGSQTSASGMSMTDPYLSYGAMITTIKSLRILSPVVMLLLKLTKMLVHSTQCHQYQGILSTETCSRYCGTEIHISLS